MEAQLRGGQARGATANARVDLPRHRHRHLRGQGGAGRRRAAPARRGRGAARDLPAAAALVGAGARRLVGGDRSRRWRHCARAQPDGLRRRRRRSACRARCTVPSCSTPRTGRCVRRSCGTTAAPRPNAACSPSACPTSAASPASRPCRASPLPSCSGWPRTSRSCSPQSPACCCPRTMCALQLTGEHVTDPCDAAGTLWLDEARRAWSPEILAATGLTAAQMPRIVEGSDAGRRRCAPRSPPSSACRQASRSRRRRRRRGGRHRHRRHRRRRRLRLAGHLGAVLRHHRHLPALPGAADPRLLPWPARALVPDARRCSTAPAAWAGPPRLLGEPDIPALLARVEARWRGPSRVLFLPYLAGERTPHDDPHARGVLFGLDADTDAIDVVQAVMEGVAFSLAEAQDCLADAGTEVRHWPPSAAARAARSGCVCSPPCSTARSPSMPAPPKGPAFGAARLARLAVTGEPVADVCRKPEIAAILAPERDLRRRLRRARAALPQPLSRATAGIRPWAGP